MPESLQRDDGARGSGDELTISIPPKAEHLGLARMFAGQVARHAGLIEDDVEDMKVAVSEAAGNAIRAHGDAGIDDSIVLRARIERESLTIDVVDRGPGFDVVADAAGDLTPPHGLHEGSLGLTLIRALFPKVEIVRNQTAGMTVSVTADRPPL